MAMPHRRLMPAETRPSNAGRTACLGPARVLLASSLLSVLLPAALGLAPGADAYAQSDKRARTALSTGVHGAPRRTFWYPRFPTHVRWWGEVAALPRLGPRPEGKRAGGILASTQAAEQTSSVVTPRAPSLLGAASPVAAASRERAPAFGSSAGEMRLLERAEALLARRDISAARLILERAAESGSRRALFLLARSYDPRVLEELQVFGISGDEAKARELYARAAEPRFGAAP
jgi:hypothetical protein